MIVLAVPGEKTKVYKMRCNRCQRESDFFFTRENDEPSVTHEAMRESAAIFKGWSSHGTGDDIRDYCEHCTKLSVSSN